MTRRAALEMKGIVLAGGEGTRLQPMTRVVNKHLLPVYDRPMVFFPLDTLQEMGISEACVVLGGREPEEVEQLVRAERWGFRRIDFVRQRRAGGIADALRCARGFGGDSPLCVILGDNILEDRLAPHARAFLESREEARVFLSPVDDPQRFGVPSFDQEGRITTIVEKPTDPDSRYAVLGVYFYRPIVFELLDLLTPSMRGELEVTDLNNHFARRHSLGHEILNGFWGDAGTTEGLHRAANYVRRSRTRTQAVLSEMADR